MSGSKPNTDEQRRFYDAFLHSRMLSYRLHGNPRIEAAIRMVLPYVRKNARVLDIGCGIGIAAERLARSAQQGRVWACDLSADNVWYARRTIPDRNVDFFVCDVVDGFEDLSRRVTEPVDVMVLLDVIEHLPPDQLPRLLRRLGGLGAPGAILALSYPSPAYQRFLRRRRPEELQPIDEIIEAGMLVGAAGKAGFQLLHYGLIDLELTGQYVHCVFRLGDRLEPVVQSRAARIIGSAGAFLDKYVRVPLRRRRFVDRVFPRD